MTRTSYILVPEGYDTILSRGLQPGDRFVLPRITRKNKLVSYERGKVISRRSLLPVIAALWLGLSDGERTDWNSAGAIMHWSGWRLFTQDTAERIRLSLTGLATPSVLHQSWVGNLHIASPASGIRIRQDHPQSYYVRHKVRGTKAQYTFTQIIENFTLPIDISINYAADFIDVGANPFVRFFARVRSLYQGRNLYTDCLCELDRSTDWTTATADLSAVQGKAISYTLYLECQGVTGDLYFDDLQANHNGQNWVRDAYCQYVHTSFSSVFFEVEKDWAADYLPDGSDYGTTYPLD